MCARRLFRCLVRWLTAFLAGGITLHGGLAERQALIAAILSEDGDAQVELVQKLVEAPDPVIDSTLTAWRGGSLYLHEAADGTKIPFLLSSSTDAEGRARALRLLDDQPIADEKGVALQLAPAEATAADTSSKLRKIIKTTLDLRAIRDPNPQSRRDAVTKLGQEQNVTYLPHFEARLATEKEPEVRRALEESIAQTQVASADGAVRVQAIKRLGEMHSIVSLNLLQTLEKEAKSQPDRYGKETVTALHDSILAIENYLRVGNLFGTAFRGLSLSAVLLVASLGLAITFGLMGVINMAHGEVMMVGAYAAFVTQNIFESWFGRSGRGFDCYFLVALGVAFVSAGLVGLLLERGIIRFLYKRPLESMLATWGVSLVLQQIFRHIFGAANVQVNSPSWMSGSFVVSDVLLAYNRIFVIGFAVFIVFATYLLLTRTSLGLQIRAVMQNRAMASALGVRTDRVNLMTFGYGSGLAGMAGACLSQIGNVGPGLGQNYIVDCFMIVVLGGVGNVAGTVSASLGVGVTDQILQPWLGAVMGKITVLAAIILFLQWRPAGLFVTRSRSLEG